MGARLTLVIGDGDGQEGEENGPRAGVGHPLDNIVDLGRDVDVAQLGIGQHRRECGRVGLHRAGLDVCGR